MDAMRTCPYCGEDIRVEATRCRWCRSRLTTFDPERWHRDHPDRRLAGVAVALSRALAVPVGAVRVAFVVLTFVHALGPLLYVALWLLIPFRPGEDALLTQALVTVREMLDRMLGHGTDGPRRPHASGPTTPGGGSPPPPTMPVEPHA